MDIEYINALGNTPLCIRKRIRELESEVQLLQKKVKKISFTEETFFADDKKLKYYTGLPSLDLFNFLLQFVKEVFADIVRDVRLTPFQVLLLTLMKLRLNRTFTELHYDFSIPDDTAAKIFRKTIIILALTFKEGIHWPKRKVIQCNTPTTFRSKFGTSVRVIIDCFEIKTQTPSRIKAKSQVFSQYKHYHTLKYLIGITPFGFISYISNGWGGRTSDTEIIQKSDFLDFLEPGDVVLADRGFGKTVAECIKRKKADLITPSFTKGKQQLHPLEVESTRSIASCRIHVERVIGQLRNKFAILRGPVEIKMLQYEYNSENLFDYIVHVCCILNNMFDCIVNTE